MNIELTGERATKIAIVGCTGMLGHKLLEHIPQAGFEAVPVPEDEVDIRDADAIDAAIGKIRPAAVVNAAAYTDVDGCEDNTELAFAVNATGAGNVAAAASDAGAALVHISTDYVFDGRKKRPYVENDPTNPQGVYAASKLQGEKEVLRAGGRPFIVRTAWLFGPHGKNFVDTMLRLGADRETLSVVKDQIGSPTYTGHLAAGIARILYVHLLKNYGEPGIYHLTAAGCCSWHEFATAIFESRPGKVREVRPITTGEYVDSLNRKVAPRPAYSVLSNEKVKASFGVMLPHWKDGLADYLDSHCK